MAVPFRKAPPQAEVIAAARGGATPTLDALETLSIGRCLDQEETRIEEGVSRLPTGLERLDAALGGGFSVPSLNFLGAAPKSGKSTLTQIIATRHVEAGGAVYYLDLENGKRRFVKQLLCRHAELGMREVTAALQGHRASVFASRAAAERWQAAKAWLRGPISEGLFLECTPPPDFEARLAVIRAATLGKRLLVVIDSLQKLPLDLEDRRAGIDKWVRFFERLRHELDAVFLVISEIKRSGRGTYEAHEAAFKESGGIEYSADLAMTLTRPRADEDEEACSTLRIELARDADEDPRGEVASYVPIFPFYGLEEREPAERRAPKQRGPRAEKGEAAREFLTARLAAGPVVVGELVDEARSAGVSRSVLYLAKAALELRECTLGLKSAWRLP